MFSTRPVAALIPTFSSQTSEGVRLSGRDEFARPYKGIGLSLFNRYLRACSSLPSYHREVLVIQSSGSGKSRLITEALKTHLGILFNVRGMGKGSALWSDVLKSATLTVSRHHSIGLSRPGLGRRRSVEEGWPEHQSANWAWSAHLRNASVLG